MKKKVLLLLGIVTIVSLVIGGKLYTDSKKLEVDMLEIVKSDEAKQVFENGLKKLDSKALMTEGAIQSYEIDYDSIEHNPMGGIDITLIINDNKSLKIDYNIDKNDGKTLQYGSILLSDELSDKLNR